MTLCSFQKCIAHLTCVASAWVVGCAVPAIPPDPHPDFTTATGVADPIAFKVHGGPIDVDVAAPTVLTLPDALRLALTNAPRVQAAAARARAALAEAEQARLWPNPVLGVAVRFPEGGGTPDVEAGLAADLLALLQRPRRASAADHRLRAASSEALGAALDVVADVQERYAAVQALDAQVAVLGERRQIIGRLLESAKARLDAGEGTRLDVLTLDTERVELEGEIAERAAERRDQRLALARLIGTPSTEAEWRVSPWEPTPLPALPESAWVSTALERRPEIQARRWELAALGDEAALTRFAPFDGAEVGAEAERDDGWSLGPAASSPLPLFDWGQGRRAKARAEQIEARHQLTEARRQVVEDVRRALAALAGARAALERVELELVPLQRQRREQAEAAYQSGSADVTAVLLAEQGFQTSRAKRIELQRKASAALFRLRRAAGGPGAAATLARPPDPSEAR